MSHPDSHFRDKLYDLETPLGNRMSFEEVMNRRKAGRKLLWWKPVVIVLAGLFTIAGSAYFYMGDETGVKQAKLNQRPGMEIAGNSGSNKAKSGLSTQFGNDKEAVFEKNNSTNETVQNVNPNTGKSVVFAEESGEKNVSGAVRVAKPLGKDAPDLIEEQSGNTLITATNVEWEATLKLLKKMGLFKEIGALEMAEFEELKGLSRLYNMPKKSMLPDFIEFSMITGGSGYRNFDENADFSVRGNHQFSQYRALALYSLPGDVMLGAGVFSEWSMGAAQIRSIENKQRMVIDSHTVVIIQPGLPPKTVVVKDTSMVADRVSVGSEASYRMNKFAVPLALRYLIHAGKGSIRLGMDIAPGMIVSQSGSLFNRNTVIPAEQLASRALSLDLKLSAGVQMALSSKTSVVAEPVLNLQTVRGAQWKQFNRAGLGFGLGFVYRL